MCVKSFAAGCQSLRHADTVPGRGNQKDRSSLFEKTRLILAAGVMNPLLQDLPSNGCKSTTVKYPEAMGSRHPQHFHSTSQLYLKTVCDSIGAPETVCDSLRGISVRRLPEPSSRMLFQTIPSLLLPDVSSALQALPEGLKRNQKKGAVS